jgi:hypothetical protein
MASIRPKAYPCLKILKNNPATQKKNAAVSSKQHQKQQQQYFQQPLPSKK